MSDHVQFLQQRVVLIQVPPEQEWAAKAAEVAALPPGPEQLQARDAVFAKENQETTAQPPHRVTPEEQQAALAMALLYAQQLVLGCGTKSSRDGEERERPLTEQNEDSEDA